MSMFDRSTGASKDGGTRVQKLVSLGELSLGGAIFTVSVLGLAMHFAGTETPITAAIFAAGFGALATFLFLAVKLRVFK